MQLTPEQFTRIRQTLMRAQLESLDKTHQAINDGYAVLAHMHAVNTVRAHHAWEDVYNLENE
jgi:hypothetical protein